MSVKDLDDVERALWTRIGKLESVVNALLIAVSRLTPGELPKKTPGQAAYEAHEAAVNRIDRAAIHWNNVIPRNQDIWEKIGFAVLENASLDKEPG